MRQSYIYSFNGIANFFRGFLPSISARSVKTNVDTNTTFVWRNSVTDGYKIGLGYQDQPMDLSNYLLLRTKELLFL
jgi:hypothetical protein